eukprot:TRINITY_DN224_c0_g1_i12.p2 TRINITY_DN224_c0_g1~~TRINITY_DN224_c0_g1_i12.p2  ORF type:complete len:166 (+),score=5.76 TRINITY_DN224_c0_g1_i12:31-528(+)
MQSVIRLMVSQQQMFHAIVLRQLLQQAPQVKSTTLLLRSTILLPRSTILLLRSTPLLHMESRVGDGGVIELPRSWLCSFKQLSGCFLLTQYFQPRQTFLIFLTQIVNNFSIFFLLNFSTIYVVIFSNTKILVFYLEILMEYKDNIFLVYKYQYLQSALDFYSLQM